MGGSQSQELQPRVSEIKKAKLESDFSKLDIQKVDFYFDSISQLLQQIETIRQELAETEQQLLTLTGLELSPYQDFRDIAQVFFWALSGNNEADISSVCHINEKSVPFIQSNTEGMEEDVIQLAEVIKTYLNNLQTAEARTHDVYNQLLDFLQNSVENLKVMTYLVKQSTTDPEEVKLKIMTLGDNVKFASAQINKAIKIRQVINDKIKDIRDTIPILQEDMEIADQIGRKCYRQQLLKPSDIALKFKVRGKWREEEENWCY